MNCSKLRRRAIHTATVISLGLVFVASASNASEGGDDFDEMSLEALLGLRLDQMAISGIHHTHEKGEWMVGYHFMAMGMDGNRNGTHQLSTQDVFDEGYAVVPLEMYMEMHMLHVMYGVTDRLTAMLVVPYLRKSMDHIRADGVNFTTRARGLGDIELAGLFSAYRDDTHRVIAKGGLSFPSGSISETDNLPGMMGNPGVTVRLPYPMQLGSGTWDLLLGGTYLGQTSVWSWGGDVSGIVRLGRNKYDYRLGDEYEISAWGARLINSWSSGSLRLRWDQRFNIHGQDDSLNPAMAPTANPDLQASRRLDMLFGINVFETEGALSGSRLMVEAGLPVYQNLDGPQLETDWIVSVNVERTF